MISRTILTAAAVTFASASAFAHPGDHTTIGDAAHFMTHLDHLLPLAAAAAVIAIYIKKPAAVMRALERLTRRTPK